MVTILRNEDNSAQELGRSLGNALGTGIASLASHKINKMQDKHLEQRLIKDGIQPQLASLLVSVGPKAREEYFKNQFDFHKFQNQPQPQQQQMQQPVMQPQRQQQAPMQPVAQQNVPRDLQMANKPNTQDILRSLAGQGPQQPFGGMQPQQGPQQQQQFAPQQQAQPQFGQQSPNQQFGQAAAEQQVAQQLQQQQGNFSRPREDTSLQSKEEIASQTRRKILVEKLAEEKLNQGDEAERKLGILEKMGEIVHKVSGGTRSNLSSLTGTRALFTSPETSEFDKLAADLLPQGLTQEQLRSERLKFPHAGLPEKANKRLIQELKKKYSKDIDEAYTTQSIIEANGGQVPEDFRKQLHYALKEQPTPEIKKKEANIAPISQQEDQEESPQASLLRNALSSGAKSVSDIAQLPGLPAVIAESGKDNPLIKSALNASPELKAILPLSKAIGAGVDAASKGINKLTNNYFKPKNEGEEVLQDYASMIPLYVLGGGAKTLGGIASFLGKTAVGRAVGQGLEEVGLGKPGKLIGEIGVPALFEVLNLNNMKKYFEPMRGKTYENLPKVAGDHTVDASAISEALEKSNNIAKRRKDSDVIFKNLNHAEELIQDGKIALKELQPLKVELNELVYDDNVKALKPLLNSIKDTAKLHPEYSKELNKADKLHTFILGLDDKIDDAKNFMKDTLTTIPINKKYLAKKAAKVVLDNPHSSAYGALKALYKDLPDQAGKYAIDAIQSAAKKQSAPLISSLYKLGQLIDRAEEE